MFNLQVGYEQTNLNMFYVFILILGSHKVNHQLKNKQPQSRHPFLSPPHYLQRCSGSKHEN